MTPPETNDAQPGPGDLWGNANFVMILVTRSASVGARQMLSVAVGWDVYARTQDVTNLGLIGLAMFFPLMLFAIPAGVFADRFDRKILLFAALSVQVVSTAAMGLWLGCPDAGVMAVLALLFVSSSAQAFFNPALASTVARLVRRELLSRAVASVSSASKISQLGGPVLAGLLIAVWPGATYWIIAAVFCLGAVAVLMVRANLRIAEREPVSLSLLLGGVRFILRTPTVLAAISIDMIAVLFGGVMGILPVFATDILGVGPEGLGIMRAAPAVGALGVGMALATWQLPWPVGRSFFVSLTLFGIAILVFSVSRNFILSLMALVLYGASDMVSVYVRQTLIQIDTPDALRGRVSAVNMFSAGGSTQLGDFRSGAMAGMVGTPMAVALGGLITLAATAIWYRRFPALRDIRTF